MQAITVIQFGSDMFMLKSLKLITISFSFILFSEASFGESVIYDAHIHYDEEMWDSLSAEQAIAFLKEQNIQRALVSATPTEGAEKLYRSDADLVIPMLRPYKSWRHRYYWFKDPELKQYLEYHLSKVPYRGFGEFHVFGEDADSKPVEEMIALARQRKLVLHPHTDLKAMRLFLQKAPDLVIIWAHGGFNVPVETLMPLMDSYPKLYIELSLREGMVEDGETLTAQWKQFLINYSKRFLVGADTYKPSRWADLPETVSDTRSWLKQLPEDVAEDIARNNIIRLFPK